MCNPVGSDTNGEWVKIKNTGSEQIDITGWKFNDGSNHNLNIPPKNGGSGDMILDTGEVVLLANKADQVSGASTIIDTVMSLNNSSDTLSLLDSSGAVVDTYTYTVASGTPEGELCKSTITSTTNISTTTDTISPPQTNVVTVTNEVTKYNTVTIQPPEDIHIRTKDKEEGSIGGDINFIAEVYNAMGDHVSGATCIWVFGDGTSARGCKNTHQYQYEGVYRAQVRVEQSGLSDTQMVEVIIHPTLLTIKIDRENKFIEIQNKDVHDIELNHWMIRRGYSRVAIPEGTIIPAETSVKFPIKSLGLDTRRHDKEVVLYDSAGDVVSTGTYKSEKVEDVEVKVETELIANVPTNSTHEKIKEKVLLRKPENVAQGVEVKKIMTTEHSKIAMGTQVPVYTTSIVIKKPKEKVAVDNKEKMMHTQLASATTIENLQSIFSIKRITWLIALFAILLLVVVGVIFGVSNEENSVLVINNNINKENSTSDNQELSAEDFEIIETKS